MNILIVVLVLNLFTSKLFNYAKRSIFIVNPQPCQIRADPLV
ncbi:MAG: hypothetical protein AAB511_01005 [Patescibacteria group bacterium]